MNYEIFVVVRYKSKTHSDKKRDFLNRAVSHDQLNFNSASRQIPLSSFPMIVLGFQALRPLPALLLAANQCLISLLFCSDNLR